MTPPLPLSIPKGLLGLCRYRLCWCGQGFRCSVSTDFVADYGALVVTGHVQQSYTCVAGRVCEVAESVLALGVNIH